MILFFSGVGFIQPIGYEVTTAPAAGDQADIIGWGTVNDGSGADHVDTPRKGRATIMDYAACENYYLELDENQVCIDTEGDKPGPCKVGGG